MSMLTTLMLALVSPMVALGANTIQFPAACKDQVDGLHMSLICQSTERKDMYVVVGAAGSGTIGRPAPGYHGFVLFPEGNECPSTQFSTAQRPSVRYATPADSFALNVRGDGPDFILTMENDKGDAVVYDLEDSSKEQLRCQDQN